MEEQQIQSIQHYRKYGFEFSKVSEDTIVIKQERVLNGYVLNQKQLVEIAKSIFPDYHIKPAVYNLDVATVTIDWIEEKMKEYGIKRNDLIKQLAIDKSNLSLILSSNKELTKPMRALFFYYFLSYEINRDIRNDDNFMNMGN
ncbi:hypothetical protein FNW52_14975 [Flavobacterium sp. ZT3R18]|uniref:hypothetical protein n=1 Tax=Flavobacterium sp. ZT3R18 TaxID=2594429 RepID=UPI00117A368E|nr:hypothetical protein [Flavobacterium sp. ZT3R18]TRX33728.1 hypothetical protein FNW52_14975 [Flavobacterium sp. ZT3R18]